MKKILFIIIALLFSYNSFSQCTINSLPYSENFTTVGNTNIPPCWVRTNQNSGAQLMSGNWYLSFPNSKIIITKINPSIHINTLKMNLDIRGNSKIYIGVVNSNNDSAAFDTIGVFTPLSYYNFNSVELNFSQYKGNGNYIAFASNGTTNNIDNILIQTTPPCTKPFNLTGIVNSNTVDLTWAEGNIADNTWWVYYKVDTASTKDSVFTNVKPFTVSGLLPMTNYKFWVVTDCGASNSLKTDTFSVRTHCNTIDSLPYFDNFSSYGSGNTVFPPCWSRSNPTSPFLYVYGSKLVFYFNNNCAVTPQFNSSYNIKNFTMSMNIIHKSDSYALNGAKMYIGVMDSETDFSSFDTVAIFDLPVDVYKDVKVNFNHYTGSGRYIAFRASHHNITNLNIDYTPLCAPPYNIKLSTNANITKLSWLPGNDFTSSWWVYYKPNSSTSYDSVLVNTTSCTLNNLLPNTNYTTFVRTTCNDTVSTISSDIIAFKTYCLPIDNFPYVENFNTYGSSSFPPCWNRYNTDNNNLILIYSNALNLFNSNNCTRMAITPYFSDNIYLNNTMLRFRFKAYDNVDDTAMRALVIGALTDVEDINSFDSITTVYADYNWKNIDLNLTKYNFTGNYIAFKHSYSPYSVDITNVLIDDIPSCPRPIEPKINNISFNTTDISWDLFTGNESMWKIYYKPVSSQTYDSMITYTNVNSLLNLIPSTNYSTFVVTLCNTMQSQSSDTLYFKTECSTIDTLPFIENFTSTGINAFPSCWETYNAEKLYTGTMYLRESGYFVTPEIDNTINISDLIIRFKSSYYNSSGFNIDNILAIGVMSDPFDTNTFDTIALLRVNNTLSEYDISLENYNGNGHYISFRKNYYYSNIIIDDLILDYRSNNCVRPDSLLAIQNAINFLNADLSWKDKDISPYGYWVYSKLKGSSIIDSFFAANNNITLQNLLPNSSYTFYIKTYCIIDNEYLITAPINYNTPCFATPMSVFPYIEDFNSGVNCWILRKNGQFKPSTWSSQNGYAATYPYSYDTYSNLYDKFLVSPAFNFTTNMEFSFNLYKDGWNYNGQKIRVYINSTPDTNGALFIGEETAQGVGSNAYWDTIKYQIPLNNLGIRYLIFQGVSNYFVYIDDIILKVAPTCPSNYNLKINYFNENSASLSWNNSIVVPQNWILAYQAIDSSSFNPNSSLVTNIIIPDTSTTQILLNGLTHGTEYSFALRPQCDTTWSDIISIRTTENAQLPYFTDFSDTIDNLSWYISNGNAVNGWYISSAVNDSLIVGNSLMISNNNGLTNAYTVNSSSCATASRKFESTGANAYTLSFDLRMLGENGYDYLKAFVVDDDTNYVGGNTKMYYAYSNFSNQAVLFGGHNNTCPNCSYYTKGDSIMTSINIKLGNQGPAGNIRKLIFVWYNDNNMGKNPPPSIDNISLANYVKEINIIDTICQGTPYNFYGQNLDSTGTYTHQFQTSNILDSIIYLNLLVKPSYHDTIYADICQGEIYNQFGFNDSITGFYTQNLQTVLGCDSIVNLNLNVHSVLTPSNLILDNISNYIELTWNGDEENYIIYKDNDSLAITNLKVYRDTNVVAGENYCYKIKALTGDCYSDYSSEECMIFSSIGDVNTYNLNVTLYPNPTENKTILRFDGEKENADIHIYDINGKLVKTLKLKAEDNELEIKVQGFEKGVYNIRITNSKINIIKKLIII